MKQRDTQLDAYRGLVMIYILCVIHTMYWLWYQYEPIKSFLLFEMPVIFFISGASVYLRGGYDSTLSIVKNRFKRVWLPYIIYALTALALISIATALSIRNFNITAISSGDIKNMLLAKEIPQVYYVWHLWFILPYFILLCTFHFQIRIIERIKRKWLYLASAVLAFIIVTFITKETTIRSCLCYNCFLISGYLYYKRMKVITMLSIALVSMCLLIVYTLFYGGNIIPMQSHKFPPDIVFLVFGAMTLALLGVLFSFIKIPSIPFLDRWNKYGYTIYLYQNYSFIVVKAALPIILSGHNLITLLISSVLIFAISTLTSYIFVPFESKISLMLRNSANFLYKRLYIGLSRI